MGILDAPVIPKDAAGRRLDSYKVAQTGTSAVRRIRSLLDSGRSAVLGVVGDSTGNDPTDWPYLSAQAIGLLYPNLRIRHKLWSDGSQLYGSWTTVQAGATPSVITDSFTRANNSALGSTSTGQPWQRVLGTGFSIDTNKAKVTAAGGMEIIDTGSRDYSGSIDFVALNNANVRFIIKYLYVDTWIYVNLFTDGTNSAIRLYKSANGATTQLAVDATTALTPGSTYTLTFACDGPTITATVNGKTVTHTMSLADQATFRSTTSVGLASTADSVGVTFDNLSVQPAAQTLDIYNGSVPGANITYSMQPRLALQLPVLPDQVIINYGHNNSLTTFRADYYAFIRQFQEFYPRASLVATMQNARGPESPVYHDAIRKNLIIQHLAHGEGIPVINVMQAFLDRPNFSADWLDGGDGLYLHPNTTGMSQGWVPQVMNTLFSDKPITTPVEIVPRENRKVFPANAFSGVEGSPALGVVSTNSYGFALDPAAAESVMTTVDWPSSWVAINIKLLWTCATGSGFTGTNNNVVWETTLVPLNDAAAGTGTSVSGLVAATPTITQVTGSAFNVGAYGSFITTVNTRLELTGRPVSLRVRRRAADSADVLAEDVYLLAVIVERAA